MPLEAPFERWIQRARSSLALARKVDDDIAYEDLCFSAQQAAEKAVKALFVHRNWDYPYTHDLATLFTILSDRGIQAPDRVRDAAMLSEYASFTRYPGSAPAVTADEYKDAIRAAEEVLGWAVSTVAPQS
jgi:HEPN domain-containing protein